MADLRTMSIVECEKLTDLAGLSGLKRLEFIEFENCRNLTDVSALKELTSLRFIAVTGGHKVPDSQVRALRNSCRSVRYA